MGTKNTGYKINYPLLLNIIFFIFGLVLIISPRNGLVNVTVILGICLFCLTLILAGIFFIGRRKKELLLLAAGGALLLGILMLYFREPISLTILPFIVAVWMIITAAISAYTAFTYKKAQAQQWWLPLIATLVAIVIPVLLFFNLGAQSNTISILLGIYFLLYNALKIGEWATVQRRIR